MFCLAQIVTFFAVFFGGFAFLIHRDTKRMERENLARKKARES